jgi:hypothetical protein
MRQERLTMSRSGGFMLLRRVELLERAFSVVRDEWVDILLWEGSKGGVFGHCHFRLARSGGKSEWTACAEEEELALMRESYEEEGHKLFGKGEPVSFSQYLECFSYLGPAELADRRKEIIECVRSEEQCQTS